MTSTVIERRRASQYGSSGDTAAAPRIQTPPGGGYLFTGYVVKFNSISENLGGYKEKILPGAFSKVLFNGKKLFAVLDHEKAVGKVLGDTAGGSLMLAEDATGLSFVIRSGDTQAARDAAEVVRRNRVGMSFGFVVGKERFSKMADGTRLREIIEIKDLDDVSIVVDAAYKSSDVRVVEMGDGTGTRSKPAPAAVNTRSTRRPTSVDFLRRKLDLAEAEFRSNQDCVRDHVGK